MLVAVWVRDDTAASSKRFQLPCGRGKKKRDVSFHVGVRLKCITYHVSEVGQGVSTGVRHN